MVKDIFIFLFIIACVISFLEVLTGVVEYGGVAWNGIHAILCIIGLAIAIFKLVIATLSFNSVFNVGLQIESISNGIRALSCHLAMFGICFITTPLYYFEEVVNKNFLVELPLFQEILDVQEAYSTFRYKVELALTFKLNDVLPDGAVSIVNSLIDTVNALPNFGVVSEIQQQLNALLNYELSLNYLLYPLYAVLSPTINGLDTIASYDIMAEIMGQLESLIASTITALTKPKGTGQQYLNYELGIEIDFINNTNDNDDTNYYSDSDDKDEWNETPIDDDIFNPIDPNEPFEPLQPTNPTDPTNPFEPSSPYDPNVGVNWGHAI